MVMPIYQYIKHRCTYSLRMRARVRARWSLGLVSRILVRTINEGSTIVMKALRLAVIKSRLASALALSTNMNTAIIMFL